MLLVYHLIFVVIMPLAIKIKKEIDWSENQVARIHKGYTGGESSPGNIWRAKKSNRWMLDMLHIHDS
jgi:hypothetical protein